MRKHGWQLPYHPLQVVAIAVFLALGFAFYVFFAPFVGRKLIEYVVMGFYTPLVTCVFCLYIWCAAADPGDPGVFKSKKYLHSKDSQKKNNPRESEQVDSISGRNAATTGDMTLEEDISADVKGNKLSNRLQRENSPSCDIPLLVPFCGWCPSNKCPSEQQTSEDGMFYCNLCEVEVLKYSKHCRVCDKCVNSFDHHCRWLNNCIGRKNYGGFFILMVSALLLYFYIFLVKLWDLSSQQLKQKSEPENKLILQWSIGIVVLILCFVERKRFSVEITTKLGSSFSLVPFVVVLASCTLIAMVATLPLAQLFFFHVLLIKKGISTYDYIVALREHDQQGVAQQSPQMSSVSSFTALSSTSSFNAFHRSAWCTPPRLFLEDQFDVVPPEMSIAANPSGKRMIPEESTRKRNAASVKISPWTLARLNAEEVSKAAAQARKRSKILQPVVNRGKPIIQETDDRIKSFSSGSGRIIMKPDNRRRANKRVRLPLDLPLEPLAKISARATDSNGSDLALETSASLAPLQLEARSAFRPSRPVAIVSSSDSSLESPDLHPFRVSSFGTEESQRLTPFASAVDSTQKGVQLSGSTSDGYDASGGEDSDQVSSRIVHRSANWASLFSSVRGEMADDLKVSSSVGHQTNT